MSSRNKPTTTTTSNKRHSFLLPFTKPWKSSSDKPCLSLEALNTDVLLLIFQHLNWPEDFHSLALVSKSLNRLVTSELYRTVIITPNPRSTLALLRKLKDDDTAAASVHTLVFDKLVRTTHPQIPQPDEFDQAKKEDFADALGATSAYRLACSEFSDPQRVRLRLHLILPRLLNLRTIYVKWWNHFLQGPLSAAECYHYWNPSNGSKERKLLKLFRKKTPYYGPPPVMHGDRQPCPLDIVSLLLLRCKKIDKLSITGVFPSMRFSHPTFAFHRLTTIIIGDQTASVTVWNDILRHCKSLKVLALLNVHFRFEKLMAGCYFPALESIGTLGKWIDKACA